MTIYLSNFAEQKFLIKESSYGKMVTYRGRVGAKMDRSCCFTGYRPEKFPFELKLGTAEFNLLENKIYDAVFAEYNDGVRTFYCGMAMGFDLLCGKAVVDLKRLLPDSKIKLVAAIPFKKQNEKFTATWKKLYEIVLSECDEAVALSDNYSRECFAVRNRYMVDRSGRVIAYFDGQAGGTANTLKYAASKGRRIKNLAEFDLSDIYDGYGGYQLEFSDH